MNPLLRVSGGLGLAAVLIGIALLIFACAGFDAAFYFSPSVLVLALTSGILTLISARRSPLAEDASILAGLFLSALGLLGGLCEFAAWQHWAILFNQHS